LINTSSVYRSNFAATADIVVNQGGTSSGKTYAILQVLFSKAIAETCTITVVGQDIPNLKVGALRDAIDIHNADEAIKQQVTFTTEAIESSLLRMALLSSSIATTTSKTLRVG
jgi:phage terminase large subunit